VAISFGTIRRSTILPSRDTWKVSALTSPETSAVPTPYVAATTQMPRRPETGSAVNATPDASAFTMR